MRVSRVHAHAFGALRDQTLELADGLTVVYGLNESGKSTWHAALLAALCGRRSPKDPALDRYRPWAGPAWSVGAEVRLADGRRVALHHDLDARLGSAKDLDIVADYSAEITGPRGGAPDATRWLGLGRAAFLATACVRQADLRLATEQADGIREHLQRAAATAPADATVAAALERLEAFQREHIGSDRTRTKPLQVAQRRLAEAEDALRGARAGQADVDARTVAARQARAEAEVAQVRLRQREAGQARVEAVALRDRLAEAQRLASLVAVSVTAAVTPTPDLAAMSAVDVSAAVGAWRSLPSQPSASPVSAAPAAPPVAAPARHGRTGLLLALATVLVLGGVALLAAGPMVAGAAVLAIGLAVAAVGFVHWGRTSAPAAATPVSALDNGWRREWDEARDRAQARVLTAAQRLGLRADTAAQAVRVLEDWLSRDAQRAAVRDDEVANRARLQTLLDGGSLADLTERVHAAAESANAADANLARVTESAREAIAWAATVAGTPSTLEQSLSTRDGGTDLDALRQEHHRLDGQATIAERELVAAQARQPSVAEAEEARDAALAELDRLRQLDDVLARTRAYLERAQDRVHRDIAPVLAAAVGRDLSTVTAGRYTDAVVDPGTLAVQVRGGSGPLRDANDLSMGAAEQVYLLLRVALAQRLVRPGESCPLLLDDVTAHADRDRTEAMLRVLLAVAEHQQVVLFAQQEQVREWARSIGDSGSHALLELSRAA